MHMLFDCSGMFFLFLISFGVESWVYVSTTHLKLNSLPLKNDRNRKRKGERLPLLIAVWLRGSKGWLPLVGVSIGIGVNRKPSSASGFSFGLCGRDLKGKVWVLNVVVTFNEEFEGSNLKTCCNLIWKHISWCIQCFDLTTGAWFCPLDWIYHILQGGPNNFEILYVHITTSLGAWS